MKVKAAKVRAEEDKMLQLFADVSTIIVVDSLGQANSLAKDVNLILHDKLEEG